MRRAGVALALAVVLAGFSAFIQARGDDTAAPQKHSRDPAQASLADKLVHDALAAELAGDNVARDRLLADALSANPNCRTARWQTGLVHLDGKWLSPRQATEKYSADRALAEYRRHRDEMTAGLSTRGAVTNNAAGGDPTGLNPNPVAVSTTRSGGLTASAVQANVDLARWCRSKKLANEERAHWTQVLLNDPGNAEAQSRLGLHYFSGDLYTTAQINQMRRQIYEEQKQQSRWQAKVTLWRKSLDADSSAGKSSASAEMRDCEDAAVIPALEAAARSDSPKPSAKSESATKFQIEAIGLLGRLAAQRSTFALTRLAVLGKQKELCLAAADQLRGRQLHDFVPILLNGLENPINFESDISFGADGPETYNTRATQAGRDVDREIRFVEPVSATITSVTGTSNPDIQLENPAYRRYAAMGDDIARRNKQISDLDQRINVVLNRVTGDGPGHPHPQGNDRDVIPDDATSTDYSSIADYWWAWWDSYNEVTAPYKTTLTTTYDATPNTVYGSTFSPSNSMHCSCFPAGTMVCTLVGPESIEKIKIGDRVLAQDADTGELAYKPVLNTTVRPPATLSTITTTGGSIRATRGHAFWIDGKGWRMAKESKVGDRLHGLEGAAIVTAIGVGASEPIYNLNVADFHTYFVGGQDPILVHDYTIRMPSAAKVPGLVSP